MGTGPLPVKQQPAELILQQLDGALEGGLRDVALLRRAGEIQFLADREEVSDLMHFHRDDPFAPRPERCLVPRTAAQREFRSAAGFSRVPAGHSNALRL